MICAAVTYVIKPGHEVEAAKLFRTVTEHTRREPGCRMYLAHRSTTDPRRFFLYEQYADQAALDAHRAAPHFERYVKEGLFPITESRSPELFEPLTDGAALQPSRNFWHCEGSAMVARLTRRQDRAGSCLFQQPDRENHWAPMRAFQS